MWHVPPTDISLTHSNVVTVVNTIMEVKLLEDCLETPTSVDDEIRELCDGLEQQRNQLVHYWRSVSPYASWTYLAGELHYRGEESALTAVKRYIQKGPGVRVLECRRCLQL